ncbi:MAG: DUF1819 domain-containing protein [Myxococcales bacterium]|nr:DUF1819 domain-containing protein [Myxococcales bacterium]
MSVPAPATASPRARPSETTEVHTRLLKCTLAIDESRAYWERVDPGDTRPRAQQAFERYWFGAKSLPWVEVLLINMRARFDAFPEALEVLRRWRDMLPETRAAICHWHLQLTDPMYRSFSGDYLVQRRDALRPEVRRDTVIQWVADQGPGRWTMATRKQLASKLLSCAFSAGLVAGRRDPRPLLYPRIPDDALGYLLHLLRGVSFHGSLTDNPYLRSVGQQGAILEDRLRALPSLQYRRVGNVVDFGFRHSDLRAWARAQLFDGVAP